MDRFNQFSLPRIGTFCDKCRQVICACAAVEEQHIKIKEMVNNQTVIEPPFNKEITHQILSLFVGNVYEREYLQEPIIKDDKVYATNRNILVAIDKKNCDFTLINESISFTPDHLFKESNINEILNIDSLMFEKYKTKDEFKYVGKDVECSECKGKGMVEWKYGRWEREFECPNCYGIGLSERVQKRKTGIKTIGNYYVKIKDCFFKMEHFYKIIQVRDLIGGEIRLIYITNPSSQAIFNVGICKFVIMPTIAPDESFNLNPSLPLVLDLTKLF